MIKCFLITLMRKISNNLTQYYENTTIGCKIIKKNIVDKAPQKRTSEEYANKVVEDTITKSRGRPKEDYTEEEIQKQLNIKINIAKRHYENNFEKRKHQKAEWRKNNRPLVNERARVYRAKKKLEKELGLFNISEDSNHLIYL